MKVSCNVDISKYPFDENMCDIRVIAWMNDVSDINIITGLNPINMDRFVLNNEFVVRPDGVQGVYLYSNNRTYKMLLLRLKLKRRPAYLIISLLAPVIMLSILGLFSFLLPPHVNEKISFAIAVLLSFTMFLNMIYEDLPKDSINIPYLVVYIAFLLLISFLSVIGNCMVKVVHSMDQRANLEETQLSRNLCMALNLLSFPLDRFGDGDTASRLNKLFLILNFTSLLVVNVVFFSAALT
ncbi:ligand-gated ion channel 4-like [Physella acuta]|uniref:ligand-gated ion channel 4-like n=1 Tax=Physella acuta TaxID=109671 RepID=UPI0027DC03F3|nr:ligand-gated ion channel 4-like [Physella acuta]